MSRDASVVSCVRPDDVPRPEAADLRRRRREVIFEEALRASTALMAIVFAGGLITALPFVPVWMFGAALGGVFLSLPAGIAVRVWGLHSEPQPHATRWAHAFVGVGIAATLAALLLALAQVASLETALWRLAGVLAVTGLVAWVRGRVLDDPDVAAQKPRRARGDQ